MRALSFLILAIFLFTAKAFANDDTVQTFGMTAVQLDAALKENASKKLILVQIEVITSWGNISYSAIWRKLGTPFAYVPHFGENVAQFQNLMSSARGQNLRPVSISVATGGIFASMWLPSDGRSWVVTNELTPAQYQDYFNRMNSIGWRQKDFQAYHSADGQLKFAGIFDNHGEGQWQARGNLSAAELAANDTAFKAQGLYLVNLEAYNDGSGIRYAGRWIPAAPLPSVFFNLDMTFEQLQANIADQKTIPDRSLVHISAFTKAGITHYAALWE